MKVRVEGPERRSRRSASVDKDLTWHFVPELGRTPNIRDNSYSQFDHYFKVKINVSMNLI